MLCSYACACLWFRPYLSLGLIKARSLILIRTLPSKSFTHTFVRTCRPLLSRATSTHATHRGRHWHFDHNRDQSRQQAPVKRASERHRLRIGVYQGHALARLQADLLVLQGEGDAAHAREKFPCKG